MASAIPCELGLYIYTLLLRSGDITEAGLVLVLSATLRPCLIVLKDMEEAGFDAPQLLKYHGGLSIYQKLVSPSQYF